MAIKGFFGKWRFLSNFYPGVITYEDMDFSELETAYQAAKSLDLEVRKQFQGLNSPHKAKELGQTIKLRPDWEKIKLQIMEELVRQKFTRHKDLQEKLLATGDQYLEETNTWKDTFYGVCNGIGKNHLGKILMKVRAELASNSDVSIIDKV